MHRAASCDVYKEPEPACGFAEQNMQLKSDIDRASAQLKSLHEEVKNVGQVQPSEQNTERKEDEEVAEDVWTLINDVCDKYQVHLADIIAGQVQNPEVGKMLSNIAEKVVKNIQLTLWGRCWGTVLPSLFNLFVCQTGPCSTLSYSRESRTKPGKLCSA